jgi:hypothetical protein
LWVAIRLWLSDSANVPPITGKSASFQFADYQLLPLIDGEDQGKQERFTNSLEFSLGNGLFSSGRPPSPYRSNGVEATHRA